MDIQWLLPMPQRMTVSGKSLPANLVLRDGDLLTASILNVEKGNDALLSIGPFMAYARLPVPVETGQEIQIRVAAAGEHLRMVMVPGSGLPANRPADEHMEIRLLEPISDRPFPPVPSRGLVPGELLQGRITGFEKDGSMLVDFGKFKAFAKIDTPVRRGQIIALSVVKNDNGITFVPDPRVQTTGSTNLSTAPATAATSTGEAGVTPHASAASPADGLPSERNAGSVGRPAAATVGLPPPPTAAEIKVLREQIQGMLDGSIQGGKSVFMPLSSPMRGALINLQQALNPASPTGDLTSLVARVRDFVENSGLYFEKRLEQAINSLQARSTSMTPADLARQPVIRDIMVNDLKPNLLILKQFIDMQPLDRQGTDRHFLETVTRVLQRMVDHIERQQFMATEKPVDPDLFQAFSHLMFLTDTHRNARFKVYYAKKGRDDAHRHPRVSLLLDMDRMGTVRTDLWMVGKDLNVTFFVTKKEIKAAIETEHRCIGEMLKDTFNSVVVSVVVNPEKIAAFEDEDLTLSNRRQVDVSI